MHLKCLKVLCIAGSSAFAAPATASYKVELLTGLGDFIPVTITDDGTIAGTTVSGAGSLATTTNGTDSRTYDFCGTQGAADNTVLTATSPYSVRRFIVGNCGYASGFIYDVGHEMVTAVTTFSPLGTSVGAVGPAGMVAGVTDVRSGGNTAFRDRGGDYSTFFPGEFAVISQITEVGTTVGYSTNFGGSGSGFILQLGGKLVVVEPPHLGSGNYVSLYGGNRRGQFVATVVSPTDARAAVWQAGRFKYARLPVHTVISEGRAINENGDVAGVFRDAAGVNHVFVWHTSTEVVEVLAVPENVQDMSVVSINNHADIAGTYTQSGSRQAYRAVRRP